MREPAPRLGRWQQAEAADEDLWRMVHGMAHPLATLLKSDAATAWGTKGERGAPPLAPLRLLWESVGVWCPSGVAHSERLRDSVPPVLTWSAPVGISYG